MRALLTCLLLIDCSESSPDASPSTDSGADGPLEATSDAPFEAASDAAKDAPADVANDAGIHAGEVTTLLQDSGARHRRQRRRPHPVRATVRRCAAGDPHRRRLRLRSDRDALDEVARERFRRHGLRPTERNRMP